MITRLSCEMRYNKYVFDILNEIWRVRPYSRLVILAPVNELELHGPSSRAAWNDIWCASGFRQRGSYLIRHIPRFFRTRHSMGFFYHLHVVYVLMSRSASHIYLLSKCPLMDDAITTVYLEYSLSSWTSSFKDVPEFTWWRHQMENFLRYWPFVLGIHRSPVNSPHKGQWRGALMIPLICVWINAWVNNRVAGDLRRHRAHYDVIVMNDDDSYIIGHWRQEFATDRCILSTAPASRLLTETFVQAQMKKNQSSVSLAFVRWIHRWTVNSPHKGPVTRKVFPFDNVIMRQFRAFMFTDVNPHFTAPGCRYHLKLTADGLLWRHGDMDQPLAIVTSQWPIVPRGIYGRMM